jgi:hypothetical protein
MRMEEGGFEWSVSFHGSNFSWDVEGKMEIALENDNECFWVLNLTNSLCVCH